MDSVDPTAMDLANELALEISKRISERLGVIYLVTAIEIRIQGGNSSYPTIRINNNGITLFFRQGGMEFNLGAIREPSIFHPITDENVISKTILDFVRMFENVTGKY